MFDSHSVSNCKTVSKLAIIKSDIEMTHQRTPGDVLGFGLRAFRHVCRVYKKFEEKFGSKTTS